MEPTAAQDALWNIVINDGKDEATPHNTNDPIPMMTSIQIPIALSMFLLITTAIIGNAMTIGAYIIDKNLHTVYNFYIFNLAIADLLLAAISMTIDSLYVLEGMTWPLGKAMCKFWLLVDFTLSFQTILLMLILSIDRLLLVSLGMTYSRIVTMRVAELQMAISWMVSFLVYGLAIIFWDKWTGETWVPYDVECDVEFAHDPTFTTATAMIEFILPFVCLTVLNTFLYMKIKRRNRVNPELDGSTTQSIRTVFVTVTSVAIGGAAQSNKDGERTHVASTSSAQGIHNNQPSLSRPIPPRRDNKAFRFLAILVIVFLICWAPYTVTTVVIAFCEHSCVDIHVYELFSWFLWSKSAINPFLYAFNSVVYRAHFKKCIMFWKR